MSSGPGFRVGSEPAFSGAAQPGPAFGTQFRADRLLRRDQGVDTFLAADLRGGGPIVLKTTRKQELPPTLKGRLEYEVAVLSERQGPSVGGLHLGWTDDIIFLARPFVPGVTLAERLKRGPCGMREAIAISIDVLRELERLHAAGVVHRDLKPSNVVLREDGHAVPVDFGLNRCPRPSDRLEHIPLARALYLAPEQSGVIDRGVDARTDLYATGLLLYEALSGRLPYSATSVSELLRQQLSARLPTLGEVVAGVPPALERIVSMLLRKDPRDRYQTAKGVLADLGQLADALDGGISAPEILVGSSDRRGALTEPAFIGRGEELSALEHALSKAKAGQGGLVLLEGESGLGKTWLVEMFKSRAARNGLWCFSSGGVDETACRPFQMFVRVAREIAAAATAEPPRRRELVERLGPLGPVAARSLPELAPLFRLKEPASDNGDARNGERGLAALVRLLAGLGSAQHPALLLLDDAQWIDPQSLRVLQRWQEETGQAQPSHVLVVAAFRSEDVAPEHPLRSLDALARVVIKPFSTEEVRQQVASMAGRLPDEAVNVIVERAHGNPFQVTALLQGLVESSALCDAESGWELDRAALAEAQISAPVAETLAARLAKLPQPAQRLLTIGAVLGRHFDPVLAGELAACEPREAVRWCEHCKGRFVWADARGGGYTFVHDGIRETLLESLSPDERERLHLLAGEQLEARDPSRVFELAYHFDRAGHPSRALPYALAAAERAAAQFDLELADREYQVASHGLAGADDAAHYRLARGLGEVRLMRNRHDEARVYLEEALRIAPDRQARFQVEALRCQLELQVGNLRAACEYGEAALRHLGRHVPRNNAECTGLCLWELLVQTLHTYLPRVFVGRRRLEEAGDDLLAIRLLYALSGPYFFSRGATWAGWGHLRNLNLAERYPPGVDLGRALGVHGSVVANFPRLFERGLTATERSKALCHEHGDVWGEGRALTFHAMVLHFCGRYRESLQAARDSARLLDRLGDRWESNTGLCFAVTSLYRMGELAAALDAAQDLHARASEVGGTHAQAWALDVWARVTGGKIPPELVRQVAERVEHVQSSAILAQAEALRLISNDEVEAAVILLERTIQRIKKEVGFFHDHNALLLMMRVQALRLQLERTPATNPAARRQLLARARRAAHQALKLGRRFRNNLPFALREAACVAALDGRPRQARQLIDEAVAEAERLGAHHERELAREVRGELGVALGWQGAVEELEGARRAVRSQRAAVELRLSAVGGPPPVTLSLMDRFGALIAAGRRIATALNAWAVHVALCEAVVSLLRPERCSILACGADSGATTMQLVEGDPPGAAGYALAGFALERQGTVLGPGRGAPALVDEALRRAAIRSAMAVPISVRGRVAACLYVAHGEIEDLFSADELRIAEFLASLSSAALENAEGFGRIEAFSRELETRVEERTEQLARTNKELTENLTRLRETQDQLVRAGRMAAVGTLVAGLSHELNNPLGIMLGYVDTLLQLTPEGDRARAPLEAIERQCRRCAHLVKALLGFTRLRPQHYEHISPAALLDGVMALIAGQAGTREVQIEVRADRDLPDIPVSRHDVESALLNLLTNALDASPPGAKVSLEARGQARGGRAGVLFTVQDSGPGIPAEVLAHVFDPFFTTKPVGRGTGLGLAITRQIVQAHDGRIDVSTAPGAGTTMFVWLPVEPPATREQRS